MSSHTPHYVTLYFSLISPFTYLGDANFNRLCDTYNIVVTYKPLHLMELFAQTGGIPPKQRHINRQNYRLIDIKRSALSNNIPINTIPQYWPYDFSIADRMVIAAIKQGYKVRDFISMVLAGCWVHQHNMADKEVLVQYANEAKLPGDSLLKQIENQDIRDIYRHNQEEAVKLSIFGAPTYVYKDEIFWGQDKLSQLEEMIQTGREAICI